MEFTSNPQMQFAFEFVLYTHENIFLTGKAGSGKTTFLHQLKKVSSKRMIVVAPTGVAAINAGGVTIHSFFQISFGPQLPQSGEQLQPDEKYTGSVIHRFSREKISIIKSMDLLVIDEISMVRADLLDAIDAVMRRFRDRTKPFGGVQLLMIGDIQQLAPVVKEDEWTILRNYYDTVFFFSSIALQKAKFISIELKHIYRQSDPAFIEILNKVRDANIDNETLKVLNKRYIPGFLKKDNDGYIILTTHNNQAQKINQSRLDKLDSRSYIYTASVEGDFPEYSFPTDQELELKVGAQVMFIKNDNSVDKLYYNGKIGKITEIDDDAVFVQCDDQSAPIPVGPVVWENMKYSVDGQSGEMQETLAGKFTQVPLKLAWAITIHKSQGLTFEKAIIDANAAFAHGQVYVALSRCRSLDGLILNSPVSSQSLIGDKSVARFNHEIEENVPDKSQLKGLKKDYEKMLLSELFDFTPFLVRLYYIIKLYKENAGIIQGDMYMEFNRRKDLFKIQIADVAEKFGLQLDRLFTTNGKIENNENLQERIKKACEYFSEKLESILEIILQDISIETDNKSVRKTVKEAIRRLEELTSVKLTCLKGCREGFTIENYLAAKARAVVQSAEPKKQKIEVDTSPMSVSHPELYARLKAWRDSRAHELNVPHYRIIPLKALLGLTNLLPVSVEILHAVKGIGKQKEKQFGEEIIAIIDAYCEDKGIAVSERETGIVEKSETKKVNTKKISFDLLKSGKSIKEIAEERGMTTSTIEGHLAHYIGTGDLNINRFMTPEKTKRIADYFRNNHNYGLTAAKQALGDDVSYGELKFVLKHLEMQSK